MSIQYTSNSVRVKFTTYTIYIVGHIILLFIVLYILYTVMYYSVPIHYTVYSVYAEYIYIYICISI